MAQAPAAKGVYLIAPAYRRWLAPHIQQAQLRLRGFAAGELTRAILTTIVSDLDTGAMDQQQRALRDVDVDRIVIGLPRIHSSAELVALVEAESGKSLAEGRWRLTRLDPMHLQPAAYVDDRRLLVAGSTASIPRIQEPANAQHPIDFAEVAKSGFNLVVLPPGSTEETLRLAGAAKMAGLYAIVPLDDAGSAVERVRELRSVAGIIGYRLPAASDQDSAAAAVEVYRQCRVADPTRLFLLPLESSGRIDWIAGFEDVILAASSSNEPHSESFFESAEDRGIIVYSRLAGDAERAWAPDRYRFFRDFTLGSRGLVYSESPDVEMRRLIADIRSFDAMDFQHGQAVDVAFADRPASASTHVRVAFGRRNDSIILIACNTTESAIRVALRVPNLADGPLQVLGEQTTITVAGTKFVDTIPAHAVKVYSNRPDQGAKLAPLN